MGAATLAATANHTAYEKRPGQAGAFVLLPTFFSDYWTGTTTGAGITGIMALKGLKPWAAPV
jgi:hypothetical protein